MGFSYNTINLEAEGVVKLEGSLLVNREVAVEFALPSLVEHKEELVSVVEDVAETRIYPQFLGDIVILDVIRPGDIGIEAVIYSRSDDPGYEGTFLQVHIILIEGHRDIKVRVGLEGEASLKLSPRAREKPTPKDLEIEHDGTIVRRIHLHPVATERVLPNRNHYPLVDLERSIKIFILRHYIKLKMLPRLGPQVYRGGKYTPSKKPTGKIVISTIPELEKELPDAPSTRARTIGNIGMISPYPNPGNEAEGWVELISYLLRPNVDVPEVIGVVNHKSI